MILKYDVSPKIAEKIPLSEDERIYYAIPYDIDVDGGWIRGAYHLPNRGIEPRSHTLQVDYLPTEPPGKPKNTG